MERAQHLRQQLGPRSTCPGISPANQERKGDMTKRGNGEGDISRHPARVLWKARWTEVVNVEVKRRTLYARTKEEAVAKLRAATTRVEAGQPGIDSAAPFKVVAEQWRRTAGISQGIGTRSMGTYSGVLRDRPHA